MFRFPIDTLFTKSGIALYKAFEECDAVVASGIRECCHAGYRIQLKRRRRAAVGVRRAADFDLGRRMPGHDNRI